MNRNATCFQRSRPTIVRRAVSLAIVCLIVAGSVLLIPRLRSGFAAPSCWLLALLSVTIVIPLKVHSGTVLQKVLAVYLVAMGVDYSSGVYWPLAANLQIAASLPIAASTVLAAWIAPRHIVCGDSPSGPEMAAGAAVCIIAAILLVVGLLVRSWYGFGAERSLGVAGQLAMTLLAVVAAWRLADDAAIRIATGATGIAVYSWMAVS